MQRKLLLAASVASPHLSGYIHQWFFFNFFLPSILFCTPLERWALFWCLCLNIVIGVGTWTIQVNDRGFFFYLIVVDRGCLLFFVHPVVRINGDCFQRRMRAVHVFYRSLEVISQWLQSGQLKIYIFHVWIKYVYFIYLLENKIYLKIIFNILFQAYLKYYESL